MKKSVAKKFLIVSFISVVIGFIVIFIGFDKVSNYNGSEYSWERENAYVGGDAFNYIINGTYFTGCMALGSGLLIVSSILGSAGVFLLMKEKQLEIEPENLQNENGNDITEDMNADTESMDSKVDNGSKDITE